MSDENPNTAETKPLPVTPGAPTEALRSDLTATAPIAAAPVATMPVERPGWIVPSILVGGFALLLVLAVAILPQLLANPVEPLPSATPTVEAPAEEAPTEEQPETEAPPVVVVPEPTDILPEPEPSETPVEPEPTATP